MFVLYRCFVIVLIVVFNVFLFCFFFCLFFIFFLFRYKKRLFLFLLPDLMRFNSLEVTRVLQTTTAVSHFIIYLIDTAIKQLSFTVRPQSGPKDIKLFSCSIALSMKFVLIINLRLLTIANSFLLNIPEHEIFSVTKYESKKFKTSWPDQKSISFESFDFF